uniref:Uncharacterized protein n=1 Tax=Setaria digitata TaxID=48799 RepID=A0A915Q4V2_9BILA
MAPLILSVLLVILHYGLKRTEDVDTEEIMSQKTRSSSALGKSAHSEFASKIEAVSENLNAREATSSDGMDVSFKKAPLTRKSSIFSDHELAVERKRSEIYKKIGKISFLPSVSEVVTVVRLPSVSKSGSLLDSLAHLICIHVPLWLSVVAVWITIVEIFDNKFYYMFYHHHPRMNLLAMIIAISLGLFHEIKWTWIVSDILGIATSYVIIARTETSSYCAGFIFLLGMILFDLFWTFGISFLPLVTEHSRSPVMLFLPTGKNGKLVKISTVDVIVPGIFLNIVLKFTEMYDVGVFFPTFYAFIFGLIVTVIIGSLLQKTAPAMVIPGVFGILTSIVSVENPSDLWRFEIKH